MEFDQDKFVTRFSDDLDAMGHGAQPPAPTTPVPTPEEFEAQRLATSVDIGRQTPPDTALRVFKMQQKTGLPTPLIERNLDVIETKAAREDFNAEEFRKTSPMVAKWLADNPNHAAMAQYGYDDLSMVESLSNSYQAAKTGFMGGFKKQQLMGLNYRLAMDGNLTAQEETERQRLKKELEEESLRFTKGLPLWVKEASDILGMQVAPVGTSVKRGVQVGAAFGLTGLALSAVSGPLVPVVAPVTTTIGAGSGFAVGFQASYLNELYKSSVGEAYGDMEEYVKAGRMDQTTARHASMIAAIPNAALEMLSFGKAVKVIPGGDKLLSAWASKNVGEVLARPTMKAALADFGKKYADMVVTETLTEGTQALVTAVSRELARGREAEGLTAEDFESAWQQSVSAFRGTALLGALGAGPKVVELRHDIRRAQENENFMRSLGEVMARTKVPPEAMGDFIKNAAPDTNVHIPVAAWNLLFQDKAQTAAQELLGGDIAQYSEASAIGGDLIVPLSRYAEKVAPSQYHEALLPDLRLGAGELSVREVMAAQEAGEMQRLADETSEKAQQIAAQELPLENIYEDAYQQQIAAKVPAALAKRNALIVRERLRARAQRLGRDPWELYQEQPLSVKRFQKVPTAAEAQALGQSVKAVDIEGIGVRPTMDSQGTRIHPTKRGIENFWKWSGGAERVIAPEDTRTYEGGPVVFRMFHGTASDFTTFDKERANPESDMGAGFYFTNSQGDVSTNYAGEGPDLTNRIQQLAEQIASDTDREYSDPEVLQEARERLAVTHGGMAMPVFVKLQNPVVVGGPNETKFTYELSVDSEGYMDDARAEIEEEYADEIEAGDYSTEEVDAMVQERAEEKARDDGMEEETGTLVDFITTLRDVAGNYEDGDIEPAIDAVMDYMRGGETEIGAADLISKLKESEEFGYYTDDEGRFVSSEIIRETFEQLGFDGIIDNTVNEKFGAARQVGQSMEGMDYDTTHVIAFSPEQIKSAVGNIGTFDPESADILMQDARQRAFELTGGKISAETEAAIKQTSEKLAQVHNGLVAEGSEIIGATIHPVKGNMIGQRATATGIMPERALRVKGKYIAPELIEAFVRYNWDVLGRLPDLSVGTWYNSSDDMTFLDIVATPEKEEVAIAAAKERGWFPATYSYAGDWFKDFGAELQYSPDQEPSAEKAVFNLGTLEEIPIETSPQMEAAMLFQFAGRRSLTANPLSLQRAAIRVTQGDNPETVRRETGWFKGADGKWRYEISDQQAKSNFGVNKQTPITIGMKAKRNELERSLKLSDVLDHPLLFAAYPAIANYPVVEIPMKESNRGGFERTLTGGGIFWLNDSLPASQAHSTLLHEIQHAIQNVEGFASGGSRELFRAEYGKLTNRVEVLNYIMREAAKENNDEKYLAALAEREEIVPRIQELMGASGVVGYDQYLRLAGEVEARNVQKRAGMSEVERTIMAPELTADFAAKDVIVVYNGELVEGAPAPANAVQMQTVFHGTPHAFDRFSLEAIGTGEGAQAYGWGLYFAGNRGIAEFYRDALAPTSPRSERTTVAGKNIRDYDGAPSGVTMAKITTALENRNSVSGAIIEIENAAWADTPAGKKVQAVALEFLHSLPQDGEVVISDKAKGNLYQANIPEDSELLDWDKPLSEQPEGVKKIIRLIAEEEDLPINYKRNAFSGDRTGEDLYNAIAAKMGNASAASKLIGSYGIPGLRYLDATSRTAGEGTHNYVIWDENVVTIEAVNDELRQAERLDQEKRGFFIPQARIIGLLPQADASTFIHELGHSWLEELRMDALSPNATEQLKADWETVKREIGATDTVIPVDAHEKFAEMTEAYIMEGQAPSAALREVIMQFKEWLARVYRALTMTDTKMSDDIRGVMDRLIATDEAIEQARDQLNFERAYLPREGMTDAEYAEYLALNKRAREEAEDGLRAKVMRFMKHQHTEVWRDRKKALTKEVLKHTLEEPFYRALYWLQHGTLPDGSAVEGLEHMRLDVATLRAMGVTVENLPLNIVQQDGIHPDILAPLFGMKSGDAFVKDLIRQPSLKKAVDTEVKSRLAEEFNDFSNNDLIEMANVEAQKHQVKVFITELKILRRLGARAQGSNPAVLKELAHKMLQDKPVGEVKAHIYAAAARAAGREAERAMTGKQDKEGNVVRDLDAAFAAKQRQVLNTFLHQEASEIEQGAVKSIKAWRHQFRKGPATLAKTRNVDLVNTANAIAAAHGITSSGKTTEAYMLQLRTYDPVTYQDMKPIVDLVASDNRPWGKLTVSEFQVLRDTIDGLWELSRNVMTMEVEGRRVERKQIVGELNDRIDELNTGGERPGYTKAVTKWQKTKMTLMGARAALRRVEHWVDAMDGTSPAKNFRKYIWKPVSDAAVAYRAARVDVLQQYLALTQRVDASLRSKAAIGAPEIGYEFSSKAELLGALLHTGNESNLQKLLRGRNWGAFDPSGTLDTSKWDAFIARAQREGILTKADYDYVQDVWNLLETLKPGAQAAHRKIYGFYFSEVTAKSFSTPWGDYKGGYFPAIADPFAVEDAALRADQRAIEEQPSSFMFPTTGRGFAMQRIEEYARPLSLDLGLAPQHIQQVLRFTHLEPVIKDVGRIAIDREFRAALGQLDSQVASEMLIPWLQRSARQSVMTPSTSRVGRSFDKLWNEVRKRTGLQIMTLNVTNTLQQITGFSLAATQVKPRYLAGALWRYTRAPFETSNDINARSKFMEGRTTATMMEVQQTIDEIILNPSKYEKARDFAMRHGYFMQAGAQNMIDHVVWSAAYEQATSEGAVEAEAIDRADSAVRETQGSFSPEDISRFEAGSAFVRTFTMFYSYFNMQANLLGTEFAKVFREKGFGAGAPRALYLYTMGFMIPAVLAEAIVRMMAGEYDDEDDDGYLDDILSTFFMGQVRTAAGLVPIIGPVTMVGINQFNDKWYDDRISTSPAVSTLQSVVSTPHQLYKVATEEDVRLKGPIRDTLTAVGMLTGLPLAPLGRPLGYLADEAQGYTESEGGLDTARGLITGKSQ